ncbi:MAG: DUF711 family protein, partial [Bacteroidota bacterium]|nr:DUF711 family protein [Bacteroidota bacterium]
MSVHKSRITLLFFLLATQFAFGQSNPRAFRIRTITAGINIKDLTDTTRFSNAISFLKKAEKVYLAKGYEVQTLRIATQNFYNYANRQSYEEALAFLITLDKIAQRNYISFSIGQIINGDNYLPGIADWSVKLIQTTSKISFSVPISSHTNGIYKQTIKAAAEIIIAISKNSEGGEGNFRFTAAANCPAGIPFFPAAYHEGTESFAIGLESPNLITEAFRTNDKENSKRNLTSILEAALHPIQEIAENISKMQKWKYDGIDVSPAPGLDASIGKAVETYTQQPFGSPSTLSACALITDVLKNLNIKKCGYSGLMLPVIEDKILAQRAGEGRYSVQELLLYSSVSGTGLDVVPLPGNTTSNEIENI